jgi:hypothetical protein
MVDFSNGEDVQHWLDGISPVKRRREVAVAFAARAALRTIPLLAGSYFPRDRTRADTRSDLVLLSFRSTALAWAAAKYPTRGSDLHAAALEATRATRNFLAVHGSPTNAVRAAVAFMAGDNDACVAAAATAIAFASFAHVDSAAPYASSADSAEFDRGRSGAELAGWPIWLTGAPAWASDAWLTFKSELLGANEGLEVWTDWYEARLAGDLARPSNEALEIGRATIPGRIWKRGPRVVGTEIKRLTELNEAESN